MAIRYQKNSIFLNINDLVYHGNKHHFISSFPLHKRGMLGQKAHRRLQSQRRKSYGFLRSEYHISRQIVYKGYTIVLQGRIDGVFQLEGRVEVEEIKSVLLTSRDFSKVKIEDYPAFTEQLVFYAWFLAEEFPGSECHTYLLMINLVDDRERSFYIPFDYDSVGERIHTRIDKIIEIKEMRDQQLSFRRHKIRELDLSLQETRPQQENMISHVWECLDTSGHLMVSAPTGSGKTIASLFPGVQYAWLNDKKVFFGTSKTTQQHMAAETVQHLIDKGLPVTAIALRAARKMCVNDVFFCHETHCRYAKEYRQRFAESDLKSRLPEGKVILPESIIEQSKALELCPFEVSLDLAYSADVVIGDYNYIFDPAAHLSRLFLQKDYSDWILILDEAHNLIERGMQWLSPSIERAEINELCWMYEGKKNKIAKALVSALEAIGERFDELHQDGALLHEGERCFQTQLLPEDWEEMFVQFENAYVRYLIDKIRRQKIRPEDPVEKFYFRFRHFIRIAKINQRPFVPFYDAVNGGCLSIQCCDPSGYLGEMLDRFHTVVAMSATLEPMDYYQRLGGFSRDRTIRLTLDSPFENKHRKCVIVPGVSTRFKERRKSYHRVAEIIKSVFRLHPANYLVFFPSFDYLQSVYLFLGNIPAEVLIQRQNMSEDQRDHYLRALKTEKEPHLLMAVTGGIFAEGVDYPERMASGVIVVSPSLPAISYEREILKDYYEETYGSGMAYAYIYPGMNRVIQAAGRLIRTSEDRGVLVLIGERFAEDEFQDLLPGHWFKERGDVIITDEYEEVIREFWE